MKLLQVKMTGISILGFLFLKHEGRLFVSTLVHYNNRFGKLYMGLILPFHKRVLLAILKSAVKNGKYEWNP